MTVYSEDRIGRLRMVLYVVVFLGVLAAVLAVLVLLDGDNRGAGMFALVVAGLLLASSATALRLLADADRPAKISAVATGALCVLGGIGLAGSWLAFVLPLLGVGLVFLALVPDDPETAA